MVKNPLYSTAIMDFQFLETIYLRDLKDFYKHERTNCLQNQVVLAALLPCSEEQNRKLNQPIKLPRGILPFLKCGLGVSCATVTDCGLFVCQLM